jgi:hypothetical protein
MWSDFGFSEEMTGDGSPTLRLLGTVSIGERPPESMHHSGGAAAETEQIYGPIPKLLFKGEFSEKGFSSRFLSIGLGLGYVEMVLAREALNSQMVSLDFLLSFESEPELRRLFLDWIFNRQIPPACQMTYDRVAHFVLKDSAWMTPQLKEKMQSWIINHQWVLEAKLEHAGETYGSFSGIFYDAFSSKTTGGLWSEEFLVHFLELYSDKYCFFSTYACLGPLKRALKAQNFQIVKREGFCGKRNSTFAFRGIADSPLTKS